MDLTGCEILAGGNSNRVGRVGDQVIRQAGPWSPFVHRVLRHLAAAGFAQAPVVIEATATHERLTYIDGEVGHEPLAAYVRSDRVLMEVARLFRRMHDLTADLVVPPDAVFQPCDPSGMHEVICHNDVAPYNCVFREERLVGLIDFDMASPGRRIWDIAYAAYRFAPLTDDAHSAAWGWDPVPDRARRLRLFCDAYGLADRRGLVRVVIERLEVLVERMRATASNLDHIPLYLRDMEYLSANEAEFTDALDSA